MSNGTLNGKAYAKRTFMFAGVFCAVLLFPFILALFVSPQSPIDKWRKILGDPEYTKVDPEKPLRSQTRTIILANRKFEIPLMYISGSLPKGEKQVGVNLSYVLPSFKSKLEFRTRQEYEQALRHRQFSNMLVQGAKERATIEEAVRFRKEVGQLQNYVGEEYGLKKYTQPSLASGDRLDNAYLEIQDGKIVSFIDCMGEQSSPVPTYPICSHHFEHNGLAYQISYNREKFFREWRDQRDKAVRFFESFEIKYSKGE